MKILVTIRAAMARFLGRFRKANLDIRTLVIREGDLVVVRADMEVDKKITRPRNNTFG